MRAKLLALVLALSLPAWGLTNNGVSAPISGVGVANTDCPAAIAASGVILNGGTNGKAIAIQLPQWASAADVEISGTFVATWSLYGSIDNSTYRFVNGIPANSYGYTATGTGPLGLEVNGVGVRYMCVTTTAYTSGSLVVTIEPRATPLAQFALMNVSSGNGGSSLNAGTASNQGASVISSLGLLTVPVADKSVVHEPAAATIANASIGSGGGGVKHIATSCSVSISTVAAQPDILIHLTDGANGTGAILWSCRLTCAISTPCQCQSQPINIIGTAATNGMSCGTATAPAAGNFATAILTYHDAG